MAVDFQHNWRSILGSLAAALVVILQIIQILIGSHIDGVLTEKAQIMQEKGQELVSQLAAHGKVTLDNSARLEALKVEVARLEQEIHPH